MNVLVPMAGGSEPFEAAGYRFPKNLVEIDGRAMLERVIERVSGLGRLICLIRQDEDRAFHTGDVIRLLEPDAIVVPIPDIDSGAACATLLAVEHLTRDEPLLIYNGDQVLDVDLVAVIRDFEQRQLDGGVIVFDAVHPRWSYVRMDDDGLVVEAAEKRPISRNATAGTYWFRRAGDYLDAAMNMIYKDAHVEGRFYVCPAYNEMVLLSRRVGTFEVAREAYFSLASPQGVAKYEEHLVGQRQHAA